MHPKITGGVLNNGIHRLSANKKTFREGKAFNYIYRKAI